MLTVEGGADFRSLIWLGSEEREATDVVGDKSRFEAAIARARSAWKRASSSSLLSMERAVMVTGDCAEPWRDNAIALQTKDNSAVREDR